MVHSCSAYNCSERFVKGGPITFHSVPKDPIRRKLWHVKLRRANFTITDYTMICSKHFTPDCFDREKFGGTWLKTDAVPTIFDFPPNGQGKVEKRKTPQRRKNTAKDLQNIKSEKRKSIKALTESDAEELLSSPNKRKCCVEDFTEADMASPSKARAFLKIAKREDKEQRRILKSMRQQTNRLEKKLASLTQDILKAIGGEGSEAHVVDSDDLTDQKVIHQEVYYIAGQPIKIQLMSSSSTPFTPTSTTT